jgi:magnesium-transporting ATPase (P-type)
MINPKHENLTRLIRIGQGNWRFPNNTIKTSKYEWYNFLAFNLFEQMKTGSNIYFFIVGLLQMIQAISPTDQYPLIYIPLVFVLTLNALRDYIEETKRKKKDYEINHRQARRVVDNDSVEKIDQKELQVGDVIRVLNNEAFPADLVLLESSEKTCCYIETKDLDGESFYKRKEIPRALLESGYAITTLMEKQALFECEDPSKHMYHFSGLLTHGSDTIAFDNDNFLLSGASLKNTDWIIGLVVYTG